MIRTDSLTLSRLFSPVRDVARRTLLPHAPRRVRSTPSHALRLLPPVRSRTQLSVCRARSPCACGTCVRVLGFLSSLTDSSSDTEEEKEAQAGREAEQGHTTRYIRLLARPVHGCVGRRVWDSCIRRGGAHPRVNARARVPASICRRALRQPPANALNPATRYPYIETARAALDSLPGARSFDDALSSLHRGPARESGAWREVHEVQGDGALRTGERDRRKKSRRLQMKFRKDWQMATPVTAAPTTTATTAGDGMKHEPVHAISLRAAASAAHQRSPTRSPLPGPHEYSPGSEASTLHCSSSAGVTAAAATAAAAAAVDGQWDEREEAQQRRSRAEEAVEAPQPVPQTRQARLQGACATCIYTLALQPRDLDGKAPHLCPAQSRARSMPMRRGLSGGDSRSRCVQQRRPLWPPGVPDADGPDDVGRTISRSIDSSASSMI